MNNETIEQNRQSHAAEIASIGSRLGSWARVVLGILGAGAVLFSFFWVATRPLRKAKEVGDRIEIMVLHSGTRDADQAYQRLVDDFERSHPHIKVKRINVPVFYEEKIKTLFASGNPADVILLQPLHCIVIVLSSSRPSLSVTRLTSA